MAFEELDSVTREWMLQSFDEDEADPNPYRAKDLTPVGRREFARLMRAAISGPNGNELTLGAALSDAGFWNSSRSYVRRGKTVTARVDPSVTAKRLALTEFNTYYVSGLAHRLLAEGEAACIVYRAANPETEPASCSEHEGQRYSLTDIIAGHRANYWPEPGDPTALSIPAGPNCHHSIRRWVI